MKENLINWKTLGADPELFLYSPQRLKYIPIIGLVGGSKENPMYITHDEEGNPKGHAIQEDGCALEFCIPPCISKEQWLTENNFMKTFIKDTICKNLEMEPHYVASVLFHLDDVDNERAQHAGCSPDYNAYTLKKNKFKSSNKCKKAAGGHLHVGYENPNTDDSILLIKAMDLFLGVPSVLLDEDTERKSLYGKAGCYRLKASYGFEYRTLSNFWLKNDETINWVHDQVQKAIDFVNTGGIITNEKDIINCINNSNKELAYEILSDYNIEILQLEEK